MLNSSDIRHNRNCYSYLKELIPLITNTVLKKNIFPELQSILTLSGQDYDANEAYGTIYSYVQTYLEERIDSIYPRLTEEEKNEVDKLIFTIYHNNNHILEDTEWFKEVSTQIRPQSNAGHLISYYLEDISPVINKQSPKKAESLFSRFTTLFTPNFKPQLDTNVPSIKRSTYESDISLVEYRFSTQGQRHNGQERVSPLFRHWLTVSAQRCSPKKSINHVYFNNLGLDRGTFDIPGTNEKELSKALHQLEANASLKIAVITLPASKGIMGAGHYKATKTRLPYSVVFNELLDIARFEKHPSGVADFKISPKVRDLLFGSKKNEKIILNDLLAKSFAIMGINPTDIVSPAQKQAVWLHFIKFELTNYILNKLQPTSCNFSCKDAIDRGAVSSIYYHLHKSFSLNQPMSKEEFERDLDIAAANVKGRGMNFHRQIIWNAIDAFVNANYESLLHDKNKSWLIFWRDMNCPHARVHDLIGLRLKQYEHLLDALPTQQEKMKTEGLKLLSAITVQYTNQVSGQRLLLEALSRSIHLLVEKPTSVSIKAYINLAHELKINHPVLLIIAGAMLTFLGVLLCSSSVISQGIAKVQAGFFAPQRTELCQQMMNSSTLENTGSQDESIETDKVVPLPTL